MTIVPDYLASSTILIVDDTPNNLQLLFQYLKSDNYKLFVAYNGSKAIEIAKAVRPDLILLDVMMSELDGFTTCSYLKKKVETKDIPIIFMTALAETANKVQGFKLGAVDYITKPVEQEELLARVHTHLSLRKLNQRLAEDAARQKLLFDISDRIRRSLDLESILQTATQEIRALLDCDLVWIAGLEEKKISVKAFSQSDYLKFPLPETIPQTCFYHNSAQYQSYLQGNVRIIANNDCNITSDRFKLCISQNGAIAPILIDRENDNTLWGWLVANRCQSLQPWSGEEIDLLQKVRMQLAIAIKQGLLYQQISQLALLDLLTQIYNRRYFQRQLHLEWRRLKRLSASLSLIMCDVDYFKAYNDTYGHQQGDRCLQNIAQAISSVVKRSGDVVARYGGEEFVVILPHTSESGAMKVAEKMRIAVKALEIPHLNFQVDSVVTVSLGVAHTIPNERDSINGLIETADCALYEAKKRGRDCVSVYSGDFLHLQSQLMREIH